MFVCLIASHYSKLKDTVCAIHREIEKEAMAELRHSSSSLGSRSSSSPLRGPAGDEDSTSYSSPHHSDDEEERHPSRDRDRPIWWFHFLLGDDLRAKTSSSKVSIFLVLFLSVASLISVYAIVNHLVRRRFDLIWFDLIRKKVLAFWFYDFAECSLLV